MIYYQDELRDEFSEIQWKETNFDYKKIAKTPSVISQKIKRYLCIPIAGLYMKIRWNYRIKYNAGKQTEFWEDMKKGIFIYGNHTNAIPDALIPFIVFKGLPVWVIAGRENMSIPLLGRILPNFGLLPLPKGKNEKLIFHNRLKGIVEEKGGVMIYPEAHIWPFYTGIRNYSDSSFGYPVRMNMPVYVITNVYRKRRFRRLPSMETYVDGPIYPHENSSEEESSLSVMEQRRILRDKVYGIMKQRSLNNNVEYIQYYYKDKNEI